MSANQFLFVILTLLGMKSYSQSAAKELNNWSFKSSEDPEWLPCTIPGNSITALLENGKIEDPYFGDREKELQWIADRDWWFRSTVSIDSALMSLDHIDLECPALDPGCTVFVNGIETGKAINGFRKWTFPVKSLLKFGENILEFHFKSPKKLSDSLYAQLDPPLPGGPRVTVRKVQCQFGWDFGPTYLSSGIMKMPRIMTRDHFSLEDVSLQTLSISPHKATLELLVYFQNSNKDVQKFEFDLEVGDRKFVFFQDFTAGAHVFRQQLEFQSPELWWPNGMGAAKMYPCTLTIRSNGIPDIPHKWRTGIRTLELDHKDDAIGKAFRFIVNGKPVFCKGANYIPPDLIRDDTKKYLPLLESAVYSNFNMIRVWGGGKYEADAFYDACDEKGLLVWQDFMFACGMYPGDSAFLENVKEEARQQVIRLSRHPCLALWCGNNENNEGWHRWGWQDPMQQSQRDKIWEDYTNLFNRILPQIVAQHAPYTSYWESSPLYGRGDERFKNHGDAHDWGLWHDEMPFKNLEQRIPRFMSEFGFQSLPSLTTIRSFAHDDQLSLTSKDLLNHQKHPRGNKLIQSYVEWEYPPAEDFESLVYLNQMCQSEGIERIIRSHRKSKPHCMGSLYWQFNDCWPGISWSGIDYFGRWKALQHKVKNAFEPISFYIDHTADEIRIFGLNDLHLLVPVRIEYRLQDFYGNAIRYHSFTDSLQADSSTQLASIFLNVNRLAVERSHYMVVHWESPYGSGQTTYFFEATKNLKLPKVEFRINDFENTETGFRFSIRADQLARGVYFQESDTLQFFPNYFDLNPKTTQRVECKSTKKWEDVKLFTRCLNDLFTENIIKR